MADKPNQGRWDHLLREIPVNATVSSPPIDSTHEPVKAETKQKSNPQPQSLPPTEPLDLSSVSQETPVLTVSEINGEIKRRLEGDFGQIWVQGEISNFKAHSSGHFYFSLKDDKSQINCVMFKGFNGRLRFRPESGMEVLVRGKISVYEPRGNYQIFCEAMEPVGAGALQQAFDQLKSRLSQEGLFAQEHKKSLPAFPQKVAVVTSPTGAAIQDILNVLGRRSRRVQVTVIPARVQGDGAAQEVVRGIELANQVGTYDVLIVGRGGGSIEDLWAFNEEIVARAIFASKIPIISAVGHEVDFTIADFVADQRAPTPSAAAEIVAKSEQELKEKIKFFSRSLRLLMYQKINEGQKQVGFFRRGLKDPRRSLQDKMLRLDEVQQRLQSSMQRYLSNQRMGVQFLKKSLQDPKHLIEQSRARHQNLDRFIHRLIQDKLRVIRQDIVQKASMLDSLSPLRVVDRGFAIVRQEGALVSCVADLSKDKVEIELRDGYIRASVIGSEKKEPSSKLDKNNQKNHDS
jgi:exodeoxyribonuclease VII large subunit